MEDQRNKMDKKPNETAQVEEFKCSSCHMREKIHYKGTSPPFSKSTVLKYPGYVMKDPFSPPGKGEVIVLGGDCSVCDKPVCINKECSIFYLKTYCIACVLKSPSDFPPEINSKVSLIKRNK